MSSTALQKNSLPSSPPSKPQSSNPLSSSLSLFSNEDWAVPISQNTGTYEPASELAKETLLPGQIHEEDGVIVLPRQEYQPRVLEDRWYQKQALGEIFRRLPKGAKRLDNKGEMLKCPTGGGKTRIATEAIGQWLEQGEKVLILVDLERLLEQTYNELAEEGIFPLVEKADRSALSSFPRHGKCVLASMQTLYTERLQKWPRDAFDKIVIDEAHEMKWPRITEWFKEAPYLGLSATPMTEDGKSLKDSFHLPYIKTLTLRQGMEGWNGVTQQYETPYLSRIHLKSVDASHIDLSGIRIVEKGLHKGEFDQAQLAEQILADTNFIATGIKQHTEGLRTWVFTPRCDVADAVCEALRDMGIAAASYHSKSETPPAELMRRFINDELTHLVNVNMLIKGINVPKVEAIARVRRGLSIRQAIQEIGRGTRPAPGKERCLVVQFDFNAGKRQLESAIDSMMDGVDDVDEELSEEEKVWNGRVRGRTEKLVRDGLEDLLEARKKAEAQLLEEDAARRKKEAQKQREKYQQLNLQIEASEYDPLAGHNKAAKSAGGAAATPERPTLEMMQRLEELSGGAHKAEHISKWTKADAEKRIKKLENRATYFPNGATEKQIIVLTEALGYSASKADKMNKYEASKTISAEQLRMREELEVAGEDYQMLQDLGIWKLAKLYQRVLGSVS